MFENHAINLSPSLETEHPNRIGLHVKKLRLDAGYSIENLAVTCGLTTSEIEDIENGLDDNPARLARVANALKITPDRLGQF
ncbi:transcriptional regulator with XRE-family HTH domain [Rhizobium alvei]